MSNSSTWAVFVLGILGGAGGAWLTLPDRPPAVPQIATASIRSAENSSGKSSAVLAKATAEEVRKGGYILYFRHAQRQKWDSVVAFDVDETAKGTYPPEESVREAVCLSAQGREEAKLIGRIFRLADVPVGAVVSSPSCRARQTAELAFGRVDTISNGLLHTPVTNPATSVAFAAELRRVLTTVPVASGTNSIITGHGNTLENNKEMFVSGTELLGSALGETGFYVLKRDVNGAIHVVYRYATLAEFAASVINLKAVTS